MKSTLVLLTLILALPGAVQANTIDLSFVSFPVTGPPGSTLTFTGTLTNHSGGDLNINGASINLTGFDPSASDLTNFILNATGPLANGAAVGPVDLFTVAIPPGFLLGTYNGTLIVQGGATVIDDANLGSVNFQVKVGTSSVPEPGTWILVGSALVAALGRRSRLRGLFAVRMRALVGIR